ncbi:ABC transporter permease [Verrucosispora sioxanthis]|uniref:ABC transporter permease n=1 Tax=Verrucosispora sioxanthis TaxID=2499994 RepID=A0A6M1L4V8_9ACTN|nr:ABC transporter permease [Verrucosispora sioxanthis]NEE64420.1 ABC transporter permease [Verrucosispora sioxanthis]NGM13530.1 ABC transporter permease [Verrucosispora sioxanthis]
MTAPTLSAFPRPVEDLIPAARDLADRLGELPSRNRIKKELRVGGPKADAILAALTRTDTPSATEPTPDSAVTTPDPIADPAPVADLPPVADDMPPVVSEQAAPVVDLGTNITTEAVPADSVDSRRAVVWPVVLLALPAFVAIWSGWVGLGGLTGFGVVHPLPGIWDSFSINSAITLPIGVETYGAYALYVWLSGRVPERARRFAKWSAIASLLVGAAGQVAYHLLEAAGVTSAPWWITTAVACLPVAVLGMGAALAHLVRSHD